MTKIAYKAEPQLAAIALFTNTVYYFIDKKISKAILS
jgi:hypothetical protein